MKKKGRKPGSKPGSRSLQFAFMEHLPDNELWERVRQSDPDAFEEFHRRFWHPLYRLAYKRLGDPDETGDLMQEMFIELWEKRETLQVSDEPGAWLRNRLWYKIIAYFRYQGFRQRHRESFTAFLKSEAETIVSVTDLELREASGYYEELLEVIDRCVENMPGRMKEIFRMNRQEGMPVKEIARILDLSPKTVKVQLQRGMVKLKKATENHNPRASELLFLLWLIHC